LISASARAADGLWSSTTNFGDAATLVTKSVTVYGSSGARFTTNTAPDGSFTVSAFAYGRPVSAVRKDALYSQLSALNYFYDSHGRQYATTDARNGSAVYTFNDADQVATATTPVPGPGSAAQTTTTYYDSSLRAVQVV